MKNLALIAIALTFAGCASLSELQEMARGNDAAAARAPASVAPANGSSSILIEDRSFEGRDNKAPATGPDLSKNEFDSQGNWLKSGQDNAQRSGFDPWFGTGPENEGSLWRPDTQDNFYFSRNTKYKVGDVILVKVESAVNDSLNSRIAAILGRNSVAQVAADEAGKAVGGQLSNEVKKITGNDNLGKAVGRDAAQRTASAISGTERFVSVDEIPVRLIEYLNGGRFKVEGSSRVLIKGAPYQVQLKGVLREEDVQGNGSIASNQVLESKLELTK